MTEEGTGQQRAQWRATSLLGPTKPTLRERVAEARAEAVEAGLRPTEVWLGPAEQGQVAELGSALNYDLLDDRFLGLRVRRMAGDGVRVGCTFTGQDDG